jgi:hypothetical protein
MCVVCWVIGEKTSNNTGRKKALLFAPVKQCGSTLTSNKVTNIAGPNVDREMLLMAL